MAIGFFVLQNQEQATKATLAKLDLPSFDQLNKSEIEALWVKNKKAILESAFNRHDDIFDILTLQSRAIESRILSAYKNLFNMMKIVDRLEAYTYKYVGSDRMHLQPDMDLKSISDQDLMALSFIGYWSQGWPSAYHLVYDVKLVMEFVDELISRNHKPAFLLKGLMLKYGLDPYQPPYPRQSREYLEKALKSGFDEASDEIRNLPMHYALEDLEVPLAYSHIVRWS